MHYTDEKLRVSPINLLLVLAAICCLLVTIIVVMQLLSWLLCQTLGGPMNPYWTRPGLISANMP